MSMPVSIVLIEEAGMWQLKIAGCIIIKFQEVIGNHQDK